MKFALVLILLLSSQAVFAKKSLLESSQVLFAKKQSLPEIQRIIPVKELTPEMIEELADGDLPNVAVACEEGTELVPKLAVKVPFISMKIHPPISVKVDTPLYFRVVGKRVYFSSDLICWDKDGKLFDCRSTKTKVRLSEDGSTVLIDSGCSK